MSSYKIWVHILDIRGCPFSRDEVSRRTTATARKLCVPSDNRLESQSAEYQFHPMDFKEHPVTIILLNNLSLKTCLILKC